MTEKRVNDNGLTFKAWSQEVNREIYDSLGLGVEDLPDWDGFYSSWFSGETPKEAAHQVLENAMDDEIDPYDLWLDFEVHDL